MQSHNQEKRLLRTIKYVFIVLITLFSALITFIMVQQQKELLTKQLASIEDEYISQNKQKSKNLVDRIHDFIEVEQRNIEEKLKHRIKEEVNQAYGVVKAIYIKSQAQNLSQEKMLKKIRDALSNFRFNNNGYIFIYTLDGINILNVEFPNLHGKNLWNYQDSKGTLLLQEMNKILKNKDETFYSWYWKKSKKSNHEYKKVGFFKKFQELNIFIGTGYYLDDFVNHAQKEVLEKVNAVKFKKPEHLFIYDEKGTCLSNPRKELIGKNRYNAQNKEGRYVLREILEYTLKNEMGYVRYKGSVILNKNNVTNDKISYVRLLNDWNWMIGTGFYLEPMYLKLETEKAYLISSMDKTVNKILIVSGIITLIALMISLYLSRMIFNIFEGYKKNLLKETNQRIEKEKLLVQQSKMATMGEMLSNIAHQWKQPLSVLSMSNSLVRASREDASMFSQKNIDEAIDNIDYSIKNLNQTISDFRNFFNPNKIRNQFKIEEAFNETFKLISSQFKNNNIEIIQEIKEIELYGSQNELQQTLINILKNAKEELVKLDAQHRRLIFINAFQNANVLVISIKDNAGGIQIDDINDIFKPYFTTKADDKGSGIGLYMCKQIVEESMKGSISAKNVQFEFESKTYAGAEFIITIPLDLRNSISTER